MMPAAFGPVLPATSRSTVVVVRAAKTGPDSHEKCPKTQYVVKSVAAHPPFPGTFSCHLVFGLSSKLIFFWYLVFGITAVHVSLLIHLIKLTRYVGEKCGRTPPISWHL